MLRIYADFNSTDGTGRVRTLSYDVEKLPAPFEPGQKVILFMDQLEIDGTMVYDNGWLAKPDWLTARSVPNLESSVSISQGLDIWFYNKSIEEIVAEFGEDQIVGLLISTLRYRDKRLSPIALRLFSQVLRNLRELAQGQDLTYPTGLDNKEEYRKYLTRYGAGEFELRFWAAEVLIKLGDKRAIGPLIEALSDNNTGVRFKSVYVLSELDDGEATPHLLPLLKDPSGQVRCWTAFTLHRSKSNLAIAPLTEIVNNKDELEYVQRAAIFSLGILNRQ